MDKTITIRMASESDAQQILDIYAPYVTDTAITFEYDVPDIEEFTQRIRNTLKKYPYLAAVRDGSVVGYAYACAFKGRAAYDWAVETTVYVKGDCKAKGTGKKLYQALEEILKKQNIINLNACITCSNAESVGFHEHLGYKTVAHFTKCGYKFHTWYDMIWMEKMIGEHVENPDPFIPLPQLALREW
ncbi:GNAT family N-acetyltransferase [Caproiciproducens sp. CPB-2]|uniref:GNAT family N-acetyltransferase n=1 Tax=Caproiciproducens sp. CPB-2 TaxID=3030017 RepID=UPI0023DAB186|nr:GNAT family N-acetyltransferase [Caproiciproducens sp. CPB-2]MDF1493864.1 GNAT family N-acetyltransferase [Caproiciproducens sp. CPB-2]